MVAVLLLVFSVSGVNVWGLRMQTTVSKSTKLGPV